MLERDYTPEGGQSNPFLHMGLHLAIREQVATDRPAGIAGVHASSCARPGDAHEAEHRMIECLGEAMWRASATDCRRTRPHTSRRCAGWTRREVGLTSPSLARAAPRAAGCAARSTP